MKKLIFASFLCSFSMTSISLAQAKKNESQSSASVLQLNRKDLVAASKPVRFSCIKDQAYVVLGKYAFKIDKNADGKRETLRCKAEVEQKSAQAKYRTKLEKYFATGYCPGTWVPFEGPLTKVMAYGEKFNRDGFSYDQTIAGVGTDKLNTGVFQGNTHFENALSVKFTDDGAVSIYNASKIGQAGTSVPLSKEEMDENCIGKITAADICNNQNFKPVAHAASKRCDDLGSKNVTKAKGSSDRTSGGQK